MIRWRVLANIRPGAAPASYLVLRLATVAPGICFDSNRGIYLKPRYINYQPNEQPLTFLLAFLETPVKIVWSSSRSVQLLNGK